MKGKVLITGASRGIGYATAKLFSESGYTVYGGYRTGKAAIENLAAELEQSGNTLIPIYADLRVPFEIENMSAEAGDVDILINNAGITKEGLLTDITTEDWEDIMSVNLRAVFLCSKAVLPAMIRKKCGCIINISSVWGVTGGSCEAAYSASKAGVIGLTKALAKEVAPSGIRVNAIAPGAIDTDMISGLSQKDREFVRERTPLGEIGKPEHIAHAALFLAQNKFITGEVLNVNGGFFI